MLLFVLELRLLLLRREKDGGKGETHEKETPTFGTATAIRAPRALLRAIQLEFQQQSSLPAAGRRQGGGQFELHGQRVEDIDARLEHPRPNSPLFDNYVCLYLSGHFCALQIGELVNIGRFLFLFYEFNDDWIW